MVLRPCFCTRAFAREDLHASFARRAQNSAGARDLLNFAPRCFCDAAASRCPPASSELRAAPGDPNVRAKLRVLRGARLPLGTNSRRLSESTRAQSGQFSHEHAREDANQVQQPAFLRQTASALNSPHYFCAVVSNVWQHFGGVRRRWPELPLWVLAIYVPKVGS
jgi:hypothetical protein